MTATAGVEGTLAYQAMHTGFGAQPAKGVVALYVDGCRLDARHFARRDLDQLRLEAVVLGPAQVHAQQDIGPVLGFSTTGAGLDIEIGAVGIHLAG